MATEAKAEQWATSASGEDATDWQLYESREEAIECAADDHGLDPGDSFVLARACWQGPPDLAAMLGEAVDQWVMDNAPETCGEDFVGDFHAGPAAEDLKQVLAAWAKRHDVKPDWYFCEREEHLTIPEPDPLLIDPTNIPG